MRHGEITHSNNIKPDDLVRYSAARAATAVLGFVGAELTLELIRSRPGFYFWFAYKPVGPYPNEAAAREAFAGCNIV